MGNQADKKFTWVIKNVSSLAYDRVSSDIFVVGRCKWRLLAYPATFDHSYYSCSLVVSNPESLPSGWRRHAKISFTLVNQIPGEIPQLRETLHWFDQKNNNCDIPFMFRLYGYEGLSKGFLVNDEVKIVVEIDVLKVIGKLDVSVEAAESVDINGFQVLASQEDSVNSASKFRPKNTQLRTYMNVLVSLVEILCKSPGELSNGDLADAYFTLRYVTKAGFKLDWLEKKLKDAGETRIEEIEEDLKDLTQKRADMEALLEFLH